MSDDTGTLFNELKAMLLDRGASEVGCAALDVLPPDVCHEMPAGVSIAVALNPRVIAGITNGPTRPYYAEYCRVNELLGELAQQAADMLVSRGHRAFAAAATNVGIDAATHSTPLPHKTVATLAGLGWIGKCALLVTEEFGSAVRITTVLTDAELPHGESVISSRCGECDSCVKACPGVAVSGINWQLGLHRDRFFDAFACRAAARNIAQKRTGILDTFCGICIAVCPRTKQYIGQAKRQNSERVEP